MLNSYQMISLVVLLVFIPLMSHLEIDIHNLRGNLL